MKFLKRIVKISLLFFALAALALLFLSFRKIPEHISYGVSFSKLHADELGLPWRQTFVSILDDLKVRKFRLSAHWPSIEPDRGTFYFDDLDFQLNEARKRDAQVILVIGRRTPGWPECHVPEWAKKISWDEQKQEIRILLERLVERYKSYENIVYWQVENEPFLDQFAREQCGELDEEFLREESALIKSLDPGRPILVTDSGNLGLWSGAWKLGDAFGTSVYMYLWNPTVGQIRSLYLPSFYRAKTNLMTLLHGEKNSFLIELSLEPWLLEPLKSAPLSMHIERMDMQKFDEIIRFAEKTGFSEQYLWGVEWWYFMKERGHPEYFNRAQEIFSRSPGLRGPID